MIVLGEPERRRARRKAPIVDALRGGGLLQSREEWERRNQILVQTLSELINRYATLQRGRAVDVGCGTGVVADMLSQRTDLSWSGIDPMLAAPMRSPGGLELLPGFAHSLPFQDEECACACLANVYEHIAPERRRDSLAELYRVVARGGVVVGQLPNPYFPIESHSRLPFMGWLPVRAQKVYWRLAPVPWEHDFYVVTVKDLRRNARAVGFEVIVVRNFNYPLEVVPKSVRWAARILARPMQFVPWAWQFVLRRPY